MEKKEKAVQLFKAGYACSQAVVGAFSEEIGLSESEALKISSCFGGGFGGTRGMCGTVSGMLMVIGGAKCHDGEPVPQKKALYALSQRAISEFEAVTKSCDCRTLLTNAKAIISEAGANRTEEYYKTRPCALFVELAVEIVEKILAENI